MGAPMPTVTVYRHGATMGAGNSNATPPTRTAVTGWSGHAIRRNLLFLYSVDERGLDGLHGLALTLTVRDCPQDPRDWQNARDAFFDCLRRSGVHLVHWVTEWQRRGVPHLHLAAYWIDPPDLVAILGHWLRIARPFGAGLRGQHAHPIYDVLGWNQYVSKHAARGLHHYQRNPDNIPQAWRGGSTGRMWGKLGPWPIVEPSKLDLDPASYHRLRRIVRGWRLADARKLVKLSRGALRLGKVVAVRSGESYKVLPGMRPAGDRGMVDGRRIRAARRMLKCPEPKLSAVRGLSEWMPQGTMLQAVAWVASVDGSEVEAV